MSRIGDKHIIIPEGLNVDISAGKISVKGSKGELDISLPSGVSVNQEDGSVVIKRTNNQRQSKANHGLTRSLIQNMVTGVTEGYSKKLELIGTGYRAKKQGEKLIVTVGYSHPVEVEPVDGITLDLEGETIIIVSGIDKQKVGHTAALIREIRKPEPYKGKGIRYQGEVIRRKAGKAAKVGSAA